MTTLENVKTSGDGPISNTSSATTDVDVATAHAPKEDTSKFPVVMSDLPLTKTPFKPYMSLDDTTNAAVTHCVVSLWRRSALQKDGDWYVMKEKPDRMRSFDFKRFDGTVGTFTLNNESVYTMPFVGRWKSDGCIGSGCLVNANTVLTARAIFGDGKEKPMVADVYVVRGWVCRRTTKPCPDRFPASDVFECTLGKNGTEDIAALSLTRSAEVRMALPTVCTSALKPGMELCIAGHPFGMALVASQPHELFSVAGESTTTECCSNANSTVGQTSTLARFRAVLPACEGHVGAPVFNAQSDALVGVLIDPGRVTDRWLLTGAYDMKIWNPDTKNQEPRKVEAQAAFVVIDRNCPKRSECTVARLTQPL